MRLGQETENIGKILKLLKLIKVSPLYLLIPIALSLGAAAFEGVSVGLLIPLLSGFLTKDFSFIKQIPVLKDVIGFMPSGILESDKALFGVLIGIFVGAVILKNILRYFSAVGMSYYTYRAIHHLRKKIFERYLSFGKYYFDRTSIGHHSAVMSQFAPVALQPVYEVDKRINAFFSLAVYMAVMSFISWKLTLFAIPLFVILYFSIQSIVTKIRNLSHETVESGRNLSKKTIEILSLVALVKASGTQKEEGGRFSAISDEKSAIDFKSDLYQHMVNPLHELIVLASALLLFTAMLYLLVQESADAAPSFMVYFYLVLNSSSKFGVLAGFRNVLAKVTGSLEEVLGIFSDESKFFVPQGTRNFQSLKQSIEFKNLSFNYPEHREVLKNVSLSFEKEKMTAIAGPTGGGKTTVVSLIMRYYDCPAGTIFIDGADIREFDINSLLKHIALVSQETLLLNDTLRNNIAYGAERVSDSEVAEVIERARLSDFVSSHPRGADMVIGDRGVKLSGGEKQRVSIARALLKKAEIIILDEATSSLDSMTEKLIQEAINEAVEGRTAIVIAHRLSTIKHADKIIVLSGGQCKEEGSLNELLSKKGEFYEMWEEQKFV